MVLWLARFIRTVRVKPGIGLLAVGVLVAVSMLGNAATYFYFEGVRPDPPSALDSLWYSIVSITTIGYGDHFPVTTGGRIGAVIFVVLFGLSTFTVFLGMLIDWGTEFALQSRKGLGRAIVNSHVLIVNFPNAARVKRIIEELRSDPQHADREIVVLTNQIEELPWVLENVIFVHGSPLERESFERAGAATAELALILAPSYADPSSDAVVASAASVLESIRADVYTVAECLHEEHRPLFRSVRCDAVVPVLEIGNRLLVQEIGDHGVGRMIEVISTNLEGDTLYSTAVPAGEAGELSYVKLAQKLLEKGVNVLGVNRGPDAHTTYTDLYPEPGDRVVYLARNRKTWKELWDAGRG